MIYLVFLVELALTVLIEGSVIFLLFTRWDYLYHSVLVNLLTNPALNLGLLIAVTYGGTAYYQPLLLLGETLVILIEAWIYRYLGDFKFPKALLVSLLLNGLSFGLGLLLNPVIFG